MSDSELGKRGSHLAKTTAERVSEQAKELRKTDMGQAVQKVGELFCLSLFNTTPATPPLQGAGTVKEELLDDIIKHSAPYEAPGEGQRSMFHSLTLRVCHNQRGSRRELR